MKLPVFRDSFQIELGSQPIVVGAPHHGTRQGVNADIATGPIAQELAHMLAARCVIVSDLRRTVDVNKNPRSLPANLRQYALHYQNEMFWGLPQLIIEVHGHVRGQYPIEISSGFQLDPSFEGDAYFLDRLKILKDKLPAKLRSKLGLSTSVGVYPLDADVKKTATDTYTFQKIRRARNRVGMPWFGLHIELAAQFRIGERAKEPEFVKALAQSLSESIRAAFMPLPKRDAFIATHAEMGDDELYVRAALQVAIAREDDSLKLLAGLNPADASTLGLIEGDSIPLYNHAEKLKLPVAFSSHVRRHSIALPARLRHQLDLQAGDSVSVLGQDSSQATLSLAPAQPFVIGAIGYFEDATLRMHPADIARLQPAPSGGLALRGPFHADTAQSAALVADDTTLLRSVVLSKALAQKMELTSGDILMIEVII